MTSNERIYNRLQQHLDRQPVGLPATRSKAELRILKHIFTPEEARIAVWLSHKPVPLETVFLRAGGAIASPQALARHLEAMARKGGIESWVEKGQRLYANAPLVVGMYELQIGRLTPEFVNNFNEYTSSKAFGVSFLSSKRPQMRTIPVAKSLDARHTVSTFDEVAPLLDRARGPFVILECICRKKRQIEGGRCQVTERTETCLGIGPIARTVLEGGNGREIHKREALSIIEVNQREGLVLQPSNTEEAAFVCSCCGCCCGILGMHRSLPKPLDYWASNFFATVDASLCSGCGLCVDRCQVSAVGVPVKKMPARVDLDRCIGCGVCVPACPTGALALEKKRHEIKPPRTREDLYDIIMANKKGRWGKAKLMGKLVLDAFRTGNTHLLRR